MSSKRNVLLVTSSFAALVLTCGFLLAQDFGRDRAPPGEAGGGGERVSPEVLRRCQNAIKETQVLKEIPIACRADGEKIVCVGTVPTKVHAGALYLACLSVDGVKVIDLSLVRIADEDAVGMKPEEEKPEGMGGTSGHESGHGGVAAKRSSRLVAVVIDEDPSVRGEGSIKSSDVFVIGQRAKPDTGVEPPARPGTGGR